MEANRRHRPIFVTDRLRRPARRHDQQAGRQPSRVIGPEGATRGGTLESKVETETSAIEWRDYRPATPALLRARAGAALRRHARLASFSRSPIRTRLTSWFRSASRARSPSTTNTDVPSVTILSDCHFRSTTDEAFSMFRIAARTF